MPDDLAPIDQGAFYRDPVRYDLVTRALSGDGPPTFYRTLALRYGSPVLELAEGTGRIAIPIALADVETVGLDALEEMLHLTEPKARAASTRISWVHADMRNFDLGRQFQLIVVASNSFSHLYSRAYIEDCLRCVRRHLASSGRFVIPVFNPALSLFFRPTHQRVAVATYVNSNAGTEVEVAKCVRYDSAAQLSHET